MDNRVFDSSKYKALGALIKQLRFTPASTLIEHSYRAEHLLTLIHYDKNYPYDFICYKITDFKPKEILSPALIKGKDLINDIVVFINQITAAYPIKITELKEKFVPVNTLAKELGVSPKTLKRWGKLGLARRIIINEKNVKENIILLSTWNWFSKKYESKIAKANAFTHISNSQRQAIIEQAKYLYQAQKLSRYQIELKLAKQTGRARETIRYILKNHDADAGPDERIFPSRRKLTPKMASKIYQMFRKGISINELAHIFGRSTSTIYRIINQIRCEYWKNKEIEYIYSPEFELPGADSSIMPAENIAIEQQQYTPLSKQQEYALFRLYNYLKWKINQILNPYRKSSSIPARILDKLDELNARAKSVKDKLILANQPLVMSIAKKHQHCPLSFEELVSEGLVPLMKSIEKFDFTRGYKFSTYVSWAIMKHFARIIGEASTLKHQYQLLDKEELDKAEQGTTDIDKEQAYIHSIAVQNALGNLNERERHILENRFGIDRNSEPLSLSKLGSQLGITKERVRQIESRAMDKLYEMLKSNEQLHNI